MGHYKMAYEETGAVTYDIESAFNGLIVESIEGLESFGKPSVYTEKFAESSTLDVYFPDVTARENPEITMSCAFIDKGDAYPQNGSPRRYMAYYNFVNYITGHKIRMWDDVRKIDAVVIFDSESSRSSDLMYGSLPYFEVKFKFTNTGGGMSYHTEGTGV